MRTTVTAGSILAALTLGLLAGLARAQPVELAFDMPTGVVYPGDPVWVDLQITNSGPPLGSAQLFVALDIGTGDFWFWPGWVHYPPDLDWLDTDIAVGSAEQRILPEFGWPTGVGGGSAQFISAVLDEGVLVSNVAVGAFSWSEEAPGTPTPGPTSPPSATPTPNGPTPTPPPGFVIVPSGSFTMGSPDGELCRDAIETQHSVTFTHGLYIQQKEVTQAEWVAVFGTNPSYFPGCDPCPVEEVTSFDCAIYCNRLSAAQGLRSAYYSDASYTTPFDGTPPVFSGTVHWDQSAAGYRLPTESEWEYACRAGTTTAYNSGQSNTDCLDDPNLDPLAWYWYNSDTGSGGATHPVGSKQANSWSLYDMHGNVWEWCWDWYGTYPGSVTDPTGPSTGFYRVGRGGSWYDFAGVCRSAFRWSDDPGYRGGNLGFRPVRTAP